MAVRYRSGAMFWVATFQGQVLVGVSWLSVQVRVNRILVENNCRVQEGYSVSGKF